MKVTAFARLVPLLFLSTAPIAAFANEPPLLAPSGKWVVDFADHQCTAARAFGTGKQLVQFVVRPSLGGDVMQLALIADGRKQDGTQHQITLAFSDGKQIGKSELRYGIDGRSFRLINLDAEHKALLAKTSSLRWGTATSATRLDLGPLGPLMEILEKCRADLREHWNLTDQAKASLKSEPEPVKPLRKLIDSGDYPMEALVNRQGGQTTFVLLVDETGKLKDCMIEATSGVATLDVMGCIVVSQRAEFKPAIGADGKPVRAGLVTRINWVIP